MLNKRPIFINAFARGGSNILMNLLLSHPQVCLTSGETQKVFKGTRWDPLWRKIKKRVCYDYPIRLVVGQDVFGAGLLEPRKPVPLVVQRYVDRILYFGRFTAMIDSHNLYKFEGTPYTKQELAKCRLLTKGLSGLVYTVEVFREMYPDATFFGLIRNGLAVCEGNIRRGVTAVKFAQTYKAVVEKMLECNAQMPNYHLVRYEEMVKDPLRVLHRLYELAELDVRELQKVRLQSKAVMDRHGKHDLLRGSNRQVFWYNLAELGELIKPDINQHQIRQLRAGDKMKFLSIAGKTMEEVGYAMEL